MGLLPILCLLIAHREGPVPVAMEDVINRFSADWNMLEHRYPEPYSVQGFAEHRNLLTNELNALDALPFESFDEESKVDWLLLDNLAKRWADHLDLKQSQFS